MSTGKHTLIDNEEGLLEIEMIEGNPFLHLQLYKWSASYYRKYKELLAGVKLHLRSKGLSHIYVAIPSDDPKLLRFEIMFGFKLYKRAGDLYLLRQET